jgi:predicted permease
LSPLGKVKYLLTPAVKTPVLWGVFVGIVLNLMQIPFYPLPAMALKALTGAFPPLLYFLLGASIRFNLSWDAYGTVLRVLVARSVMCAMAVAFVRFVWPLDERTKSILTLCIAAPIATTFIMFSGQHGYRMDVVAMIKNLSDIMSLIVLNVLVSFI